MQAILFVSQQLHTQGIHVACPEPALNKCFIKIKENIHSNISDTPDIYERGMWALSPA
jgi:hypothetical protein